MDTDAQAEAEIGRIFKHFDTNGDSKISLSELGEALHTLGSASPDEIQRMMAAIGTGGDGFIDFKEVTAFYHGNTGLMEDVAKIF